jgi:hypothetical protein
MLRSSAACTTSFAMSATSAMGDSPVYARQLVADLAKRRGALGGWRVAQDAIAATEDLGLVENPGAGARAR